MIDTLLWIPPFTIVKAFQLAMDSRNPDRNVGDADFDRLYRVRAASDEAAERAPDEVKRRAPWARTSLSAATERAQPAAYPCRRMSLLPNWNVLRAALLSREAEATSWIVHVLVGDPAWEWQRIMIATKLDEGPVASALAWRFCETLATWIRAINHPHIVQVFHLERGEAPVALSEWEASHTLEAICGALPSSALTMSAEMADQIADAIDDGLHGLHAAGLVHGSIRPEQVIVTWEGAVKLALGTPWREGASADDDIRRAAALRVSLRALVRGGLSHGSPANLGALAAALCGSPPDPFPP